MLNADRLLELAAHVEKMPRGDAYEATPGFDMQDWNTGVCPVPETNKDCGTVSCIGGTAEILFTPPGRMKYNAYSLLSIDEGDYETRHKDEKTLRALFYPATDADGDTTTVGWYATPAQAARVIRHLVETGKVEWTEEVMGPEDMDPVDPLHRLADDGGAHAD